MKQQYKDKKFDTPELFEKWLAIKTRYIIYFQGKGQPY